MAYKDRYLEYLARVPEYVARCNEQEKKVIFAYTSNLDVLLEWDAHRFNTILATYLLEKPSCKEGDVIASLEDFAKVISYHAIHGLGGEISVISWDVCKMLQEEFVYTYGLGGTGAQGAAALATLGFPVVSYITDRSEEVCSLMDYPSLDMVVEGKRKRAVESVSGERPILHFVFQFEKGDVLSIHGKEYVIPLTNRVIIDYDTLHKTLPIEPTSLFYLEKHSQEWISYNISGFNAIIDYKLLQMKIAELSLHYKRVKTVNPRCYIYLEGAHYLSSQNKNLVFEELASYVDIFGMNEEELVDMAEKLHILVNKDDAKSVIFGLEKLIEYYRCRGIVMHTKDYSLYIGEGLVGIDVEMGLTLGNLMSCTRARTGEYGTFEACKTSIKEKLSESGLSFVKEVEQMGMKYDVCVVPARYLENPKSTIGLGDTFVAGMQAGFI